MVSQNPSAPLNGQLLGPSAPRLALTYAESNPSAPSNGQLLGPAASRQKNGVFQKKCGKRVPLLTAFSGKRHKKCGTRVPVKIGIFFRKTPIFSGTLTTKKLAPVAELTV